MDLRGKGSRYEFPVATAARQLDLIRLGELQRDQMVARLMCAGLQGLAGALDACHREQTRRRCRDCGRVEAWWNHCDNRVCPICAPRLAAKRKREVEFWTKQVSQPLHVVLTCMNRGELSAGYITGIRRAFGRLRRTRFARGWRSGMWSMETTNNGRGWHVHIHALVESAWIDARRLALEWGKQVGQDFAVVHVSRVRTEDYLREVCKYAVKGSDLSRWSVRELASYITSTTQQRMFGVFGRLYGVRKSWKEFCKRLKEEHQQCPDCGGTRWDIYDEDEWEVRCEREEGEKPPLVHVRPAPEPATQMRMEFSAR